MTKPTYAAPLLITAFVVGCSSGQPSAGPPGTGSDAGSQTAGPVSWTDNGTHYSGPASQDYLLIVPAQGGQAQRFAVAVTLVSGSSLVQVGFTATEPSQLTDDTFTCAEAKAGDMSYATMSYAAAQGSVSSLADCTVSLTHAPSPSDPTAIGTFAGSAALPDGQHQITDGSFNLTVSILQQAAAE